MPTQKLKTNKPSPETVAYRKSLGKKIKNLRDITGIKQADLAIRLNYSEKFLSAVENGKKGMKMEKIKEAAEILGVPSHVLMDKKELTLEQLEMIRNLWASFDEPQNPMNPALKSLLKEAAEATQQK